MTYLTILFATLAVTSAQVHSWAKGAQRKESATVIHNKNVNIIVNVDPAEVAQELWKVIEARLNNGTSHPTSWMNAVRELEKAVTPLVSPSRRSAASSSVYQVASELDQITRKALTRDTPAMNMIDEEIMTRDIVADMMVFLKRMLWRTTWAETDETGAPTGRMHSPVAMADDEDNYVNVRIKIRRKDLLAAIN